MATKLNEENTDEKKDDPNSDNSIKTYSMQLTDKLSKISEKNEKLNIIKAEYENMKKLENEAINKLKEIYQMKQIIRTKEIPLNITKWIKGNPFANQQNTMTRLLEKQEKIDNFKLKLLSENITTYNLNENICNKLDCMQLREEYSEIKSKYSKLRMNTG